MCAVEHHRIRQRWPCFAFLLNQVVTGHEQFAVLLGTEDLDPDELRRKDAYMKSIDCHCRDWLNHMQRTTTYIYEGAVRAQSWNSASRFNASDDMASCLLLELN